MATKKQLITNAMEAAEAFRFCGPSDDPDEQTAVTVGFRHLIIQLQRLAGPILPVPAAARLNAIDVEVNNVYSAFEAKAELDALLPDIEGALEIFDDAEKESATPITAKPLPVPVCSIVGDVLGSFIYHHKTLERLFYEAGAVGEVPPGNCVVKCQSWLRRMHTEVADPAAVLGKVIEEFMEVDSSYPPERQEDGRKKITDVLGRVGFSYRTGGLILGPVNALPTKSLKQVLQARDLAGVDKEFERALANVEKDPPAAITAACSILEALFKVYIEDNNAIEMPSDQSLKPLWRAASKHLGLDPSALEDDDVRKVLTGLNSVVDGVGSLRTHAGSAHGHGRRRYQLQARHARLAIHSSHTLVGFFIETWDQRKRKAMS
jgi:Abortive infection C-terminus